MAPHAIPIDSTRAWADRHSDVEAQHLALNAEDGTLQLLRSGFLIAGVAVASLLLTFFVFGGIDAKGAHSNFGWLSLLISLMSMPFGLLLLLLGGAKWLRNRRLSTRA